MSEHLYSVKLTGPGLELAKAVDQQMALRVLNVVMGAADSPDSGPPVEREPRGTGAPQTNGELTVGEFLEKLTVGNNSERIAGIALYLREYQETSRLAKEDIASWFQRAGEAPPKNLPRDLSTAVQKKLVAEDHDLPGHFFITSTGEKRVKELKSRPRRSGRANNTSRASRRSGNDSPSKSQGRRKGTDKGPMEWIRALIADGFLDEPRTTAEIVEELARRGGHYKSSGLTRQLQTLLHEGELARDKKVPDGQSREVWHYRRRA